MNHPLKGIKVLEFARILAGPWAGQVLADLGAEVIKVESPEGDDTRSWGPPFVEGKDSDLDAAYFHSCNRGKKSVIADIKTKQGLKLVKNIAKDSDIIIENFKVGSLKKYNLDYDSLKKLNSRLIYCSITGFGQNGPYAQKPGYDFMIQALSGIMDLTGDPNGEPQKMGVAFVDIFTGLYSVIAIQAALKVREETGRGQFIDMSLMDSMTAVLANQALNYFVSGINPNRLGNAHPNIVPYQTFPTNDGFLVVAVGNNSQFERLCQALDISEIIASEQFKNNSNRVKNRKLLEEIISSKTIKYSRINLLSILEKHLVPVGSVNKISEAFDDPQIKYRKLKIETPHTGSKNGFSPGLRTPIIFSSSSLDYNRGVPRLGEHSKEIEKKYKKK